MGMHEHKKHAPRNVCIAVLSVSSTRSIETDESGDWIKKNAVDAGHEVLLHQVVKDDMGAIGDAVATCLKDGKIQAIILTGGTGIAHKDVTIEAVRPMLEKELSGFGVLFTQLSYQQIGSAAMLSRATAGVSKNTLIFCIPGSLNACKLACNELIMPELGHLAKHLEE
jgi:molybdenum cofactor biosynthesis protein B